MPNLYSGNPLSYPVNVRLVADGESADSIHFGVSGQDLADRTAYLKAILDGLAGSLGATVVEVTSTQNVTVPASCSIGIFELFGGGGAGGSGVSAGAADTPTSGGGGGGGSILLTRVLPLVPGEELGITIGAGGTATAPSGAFGSTGANGGDSIVTRNSGPTVLLTAKGARGGGAALKSPIGGNTYVWSRGGPPYVGAGAQEVAFYTRNTASVWVDSDGNPSFPPNQFIYADPGHGGRGGEPISGSKSGNGNHWGFSGGFSASGGTASGSFKGGGGGGGGGAGPRGNGGAGGAGSNGVSGGVANGSNGSSASANTGAGGGGGGSAGNGGSFTGGTSGAGGSGWCRITFIHVEGA